MTSRSFLAPTPGEAVSWRHWLLLAVSMAAAAATSTIVMGAAVAGIVASMLLAMLGLNNLAQCEKRGWMVTGRFSEIVMAGLDPAIHVFRRQWRKTWMLGT